MVDQCQLQHTKWSHYRTSNICRNYSTQKKHKDKGVWFRVWSDVVVAQQQRDGRIFNEECRFCVDCCDRTYFKTNVPWSGCSVFCCRNCDGFIDREEFGDILHMTGEAVTEEDIDEMFGESDNNKDGKIDFDGTTRTRIYAALWRLLPVF